MRGSHHPIGQIFDEFITKLHFLSKGKIIPSLHHYLDELAQFGFDVNRMHGHVQMTDVPNDAQHHSLNASYAQVFG